MGTVHTSGRVEAATGPEAAEPEAAEQPPRHRRQLVSWLVFAAVMVGFWAFLAPTQLGGPVSYVQVDGTSMEPTYENGDLILAREQETYAKGDAVTYVADVAGKPFPVIHRIVREKPDGSYVTRGDNRSEVDGFLVHDGNIVGKTWLRVPHAAGLADFFSKPLGIGLLTGMAVLAMAPKKSKKKTPTTQTKHWKS